MINVLYKYDRRIRHTLKRIAIMNAYIGQTAMHTLHTQAFNERREKHDFRHLLLQPIITWKETFYYF